MGGNAASSTAAVGQDADAACWRCCCWCLETHEEEIEGHSRQERRQGWQGIVAVVEAAEELHPSAAKLEEADG